MAPKKKNPPSDPYGLVPTSGGFTPGTPKKAAPKPKAAGTSKAPGRVRLSPAPTPPGEQYYSRTLTKNLQKEAKKATVPKPKIIADPSLGGGPPGSRPFGGKDPLTGKPWTAITGANLKNQQQTVQDYVAHPLAEPFGFGTSGALLGKQPTKLTNKQYDALRKAAAKGNVRAQQILDHERYKAVGYPSPAKDIQKALAPFTKAIQTQLPEDAAAIQSQINNVVAKQNYDAQLPTLTQDMASANIPGVTAPPAPSQSTLNFENQLSSIMGSGLDFNASSLPGIPSMNQAIADMGKAAAISNRAVSSEDIVNALLQHQQTELTYYGLGATNLSSSDYLPFVQNLIAAVGSNSPSTSALLGGLPGLSNASANPATTPTAATQPAATTSTPY